MAEFTIKWPNGAEITYSGDVTFEELQAFLEQAEPPASLRGASTAPLRPREDSNGGGEEPAISLDPHAVEQQFEQIGARNDIERVTILAYLARSAGGAGIDRTMAEQLYRELGLPTPGNWRSTFSNAATRGYILSEGRGVFRPTAAGENFARLGHRRPSAARRRRRAPGTPSAGGDDD